MLTHTKSYPNWLRNSRVIGLGPSHQAREAFQMGSEKWMFWSLEATVLIVEQWALDMMQPNEFPQSCIVLLAIFDWPTCLATRRTQSRACWAIVTSPTVLPPQPKIFSLVALNDIVRKNIYNAQLKSLLKSTYRTFYSDSRGHCACQNNMCTFRYEKLDSILGYPPWVSPWRPLKLWIWQEHKTKQK